MTSRDSVLAGLRVVHERVVAAGQAHRGGDDRRTLDLLVEAKVDLDDIVADLRREHEPDAAR